jgi:hypothetical protein
MPSQQRLEARQILGLGQLDLNFMDEMLLVYTGTDLYLRHAREPKKFPQGCPVPNYSLLQLNGLAAIANAPCAPPRLLPADADLGETNGSRGAEVAAKPVG